MSNSLILIPDISGFTEFVHNTEITHSQHIISELLEIIIRTQKLGLEIAEIEGDAVLFYKENGTFELESILKQTELMFLKFHRHLKEYEQHRICNCGACSTATNLSLKFVIHYSEIGFTTINNQKKPFGPGLVTVHRLLKNSLRSREYLLFTEELFQTMENYKEPYDTWIKFKDGSDKYESLGTIKYKFIDLTPLLTQVEKVEPLKLNNLNENPLIFKGTVHRPIEFVYEMLSNLDYRLEWQQGVKEMRYEKNRVNRVGTKHLCVFTGNKIEFETISKAKESDEMIYGEKMENSLFNREINVYYILENGGEETRMKIEIHFDPTPVIGSLLLPLIKMQFKKAIIKSFKSLKNYCEKIRI